MRRVALFATGGTISMRHDPEAGGAVPVLSGRELAALVPGLAGVAEVEVCEFCRVGGAQLTPELVFALAGRVQAALQAEDCAGAVITQGTDVIEESAYLLDLLLAAEKPVVVTGAMRNLSQAGPDGPANILAAVRVAADPAAAGLGVLVVANDEIYAAADVAKAHTLNAATFQAPGRGPLGYVGRARPVFWHRPVRRLHLPAPRLETRVPLLKFGFGMDGTLVQAAMAAGAAGLVLEGSGAGNFPEAAEPAILAAIRSGIPVVLTSRCPAGTVDDVYAYPGAGGRLRQAGAILGAGLSAVKARVKLMLALGASLDLTAIRTLFEEDILWTVTR